MTAHVLRPPTLPDDVLFSRLLKIARQRDANIIVNDTSRGTQFSYRQILDGTVKLKQRLQAHLDTPKLDKPGSFYVALLAPNGYEFIIGVLAILAIGGVVVPMRALPAEASYILQQCDARYLLATSELASFAAQIKEQVKIPSLIIESNEDAADNNLLPVTSYTLDPALAVSEETPSILFFTSGTTGPPKGVLHARRTINKYARQDEAAPQSNDELCIIPRGAFWSIYFTKLFQMLLTGIRVEIHNFGRNYYLIWEKLREQTATKIVLSPTFWYGMMVYFQKHLSVELPRDVVDEYVMGAQYLRDACATGAMPSGRVKEFWREIRGGRPLKVLYGSTETQEIAIAPLALGRYGYMANSRDQDDLGTPLPNVRMKLSEGEEGEVLVKTPSLFLGYLNSPDATAKRLDPEGFFKTGDLAILQDGRYIFKGRANMDLFKFYTYKVPRGQVEAALTALPYVAEGYIMPVADPQCDTRTAALVRFHKKDSGKGVDLQVIRNDMATKMSLPAYQLPTVLRTLREHESVPRTWSDKTAMMKAIHMFFPLDSEDRICGEETEVLDVSGFMKMQTTKLWELSGIR
ncbi:malonate--CoA ligase [Aspergillus udagawae]|nr:malonate--CoA ligase [Aspergillus udagawae]